MIREENYKNKKYVVFRDKKGHILEKRSDISIQKAKVNLKRYNSIYSNRRRTEFKNVNEVKVDYGSLKLRKKTVKKGKTKEEKVIYDKEDNFQNNLLDAKFNKVRTSRPHAVICSGVVNGHTVYGSSGVYPKWSPVKKTYINRPMSDLRADAFEHMLTVAYAYKFNKENGSGSVHDVDKIINHVSHIKFDIVFYEGR